MIRFEDILQKVVIEHGVASERLNRDLTNMMCEMYMQGFRDCDHANSVGTSYNVDEVKNKVFKLKESFEV